MTRKIIGIFDLDDTLGKKLSSYPVVTEINGYGVMDFAESCIALVATGRPRSQARTGFDKSLCALGFYDVFSGGVFEDGLFVETPERVMYHARTEESSQFSRLRDLFYGKEAAKFFEQKGFELVADGIAHEVPSDGPDDFERHILGWVSYSVITYDEMNISRYFSVSIAEPGFKGVVYLQGNDVRITLKAPMGYMGDDPEKQASFFKDLEPVVREFIDRYLPEHQKYAAIASWNDAIDINPVLERRQVTKASGLEILLGNIDPAREATLLICCNGDNDIGLIDCLGNSYKDRCLIMAPSNVSAKLRERMMAHNEQYPNKAFVLKEDCTTFAEGMMRLLTEQHYLP